MAKINWIDGEPNMDSTVFTAEHDGRFIDIVHDSCRGTTYLNIEERDPKRDGKLGSPWMRTSKITFFTSTGSELDGKLAQYCAQEICDEQDRLDRERL